MEPEAAPERVLIVDDDPSFLHLMELRLQMEGFETRTAASAEEALAAVATFPATVVVTDVVLPGASGTDLVRALRGDGEHRRLPILILTGADHSAEVGEVVGLGLAWYLRKGADWNVVLRSIRNLVARARDLPVAS